jgi:DNA-binding cell septation regulator SpoVG
MHVKVKLIQPATKSHRLADAAIALTDSEGDSVAISDIRILQNRQGQIGVAMPSRSVSTGGRSFSYLPQVEASKQLLKKIEEAVLTAYEQWHESGSAQEVR